MSESNRVYENFEDALFRLFMDRVAVVEGERLLRENEELKSDPDAAVSEDVQKRCLKTIKQGVVRRDRKNTGKAARRIVRFLPLVAITALLMGLVAYAAFPAFRAKVLNILMQQNGGQIDWEYVDKSEDIYEQLDTQVLSFTVDLPQDFVLDEYMQNEFYEIANYHDRNYPDCTLQISIARSEDMRASTDFEDVAYSENFLIQERYQAVLTEKNDYITVTWSNTDVPCYIMLVSTGLEPEMVKHVAESIILKY